MSLTAEQLYELLPAIHRRRDREQVGDDPARVAPLQALVALLAAQGRVVDDDLERLYDNLFIETCDEWVIPYLGDLLGVRGLHDTSSVGFSPRALVANTLAYRRRKGTATVLEQLALDTTGWRARAVEFFELLSATQYLNHLRPHARRTPDLRDTDALELIDTAFDTAAHTVDVRRIASGRGRHNIPNVGLFLWRLQSYRLPSVTAPAVEDGGVADARGRYQIHPLGCDAPLFNSPRTETEIGTLATELNVPGALRRLPLHREVEARRIALARDDAAVNRWFGANPVFAIEYRLDAADPDFVSVQPEEMLVAYLAPPDPAPPEVWLRPPAAIDYPDKDGNPAPQTIKVAVDPVLGRLAFPKGVVPFDVRVTAAHAFPGDVGGGPYDRRESVAEFLQSAVTWQAGVGRDVVEDAATHLFNSLPAAIAQWHAQPPGARGVIALLDNGRYETGAALQISVPPGSQLLLVSADWPEEKNPDGTTQRKPGRLAAHDRRATVVGDITSKGGAKSELWLDGLLLQGNLAVAKPDDEGFARLRLAHSTIVPGAGALKVHAGADALSVELVRSLCGAVHFAGPASKLSLTDSAIDADGGAAITAADTEVAIESSTVRGTTHARELFASNSIFTGSVSVERQQRGCVRFCFVPHVSKLPRHFRCQPQLALAARAPTESQADVLRRVVPDFTDEHYVSSDGALAPAYLQLARSCPLEIRTGAEDGAEIGVWRFLLQPQREANLRASLAEYLRLGLEAGPIFVT